MCHAFLVSALRVALAFAAFWHRDVFCLYLRVTSVVLQPASRGVASGLYHDLDVLSFSLLQEI